MPLLLTRFGVLLFFLALNFNASSSTTKEEGEGFCTTADCPTQGKKDSLRETETEDGDGEGENFDSSSFYTGAYLDRSVELLRTENTFFAHLLEDTSSGSLNSSSTNLKYRCPGLIFSFNAVYLPHCTSETVLKDVDSQEYNGKYFIKYRCHHRKEPLNLPSPEFTLTIAPVTSIQFEPYFGIPTPTSLSILVARFEHNINLPCDQISPLGLTTSDSGLDPTTEVAILVGNGLESRRVRLADLVADGERLKKESADDK